MIFDFLIRQGRLLFGMAVTERLGSIIDPGEISLWPLLDSPQFGILGSLATLWTVVRSGTVPDYKESRWRSSGCRFQ